MEEERKHKTTANVVRLCKQGLTVLVEGLRFRRNPVALVMFLRRAFFECEMGNAFEELGNEKEALASYRRAIDVLVQVDGRVATEGRRNSGELALYEFGLFKKAQCCLQIAHIYARKRPRVSTIKTYKVAVAATRAYMQYTDKPLSEKMFFEAMGGLGDRQRVEDPRAALATYVELADFCKLPGSHVADRLGNVLSRVAWVHSELKKWEAARQQYADALAAFSRVNDPDADVLCEIGLIHHNLSQLPAVSSVDIHLHSTQALAAFEKVLQKDPYNIDAASKKAMSAMALAIGVRHSNPAEARQLFEGAITALESSLTLQSENEVLLQTKARVLEKFAIFEGVSGRLEQAIPKLQESMNLYHHLRILHPKQAQLAHEEAAILNLLGEAYRFTKQEALALETLKRALISIRIALKDSPAKAEYLKTFDEIAQHFEPKPTLRDIGLRSVKKSP
jgi:tetratricopeptide (TPR) repeat protein